MEDDEQRTERLECESRRLAYRRIHGETRAKQRVMSNERAHKI